MSDLVSIITPYFNSSKFIDECVNSVLLQSYCNWELLIVDDCSGDNSKEFLLKIDKKDERIKVIFLDHNIGAANARNVAILNAKGKYIAFLDSDDSWDSQKLDKQISFMIKNEIAFSYTSYQSISENGLDIIGVIKAPFKMTYKNYLKNTIIGCLTVVIDKEKVGDFEMPSIRSSHDMALWLLIMKRGFDAYGLNENLANYRVVSTSNTSDKLDAAKDVWRVYRQFEKLSFFYSIWCFLNYAFNAVTKRI
tara:strand:+ start:5477 stop:6226 length:750 start_codon:yes stop_codon:yes gene_type:complete